MTVRTVAITVAGVALAVALAVAIAVATLVGTPSRQGGATGTERSTAATGKAPGTPGKAPGTPGRGSTSPGGSREGGMAAADGSDNDPGSSSTSGPADRSRDPSTPSELEAGSPSGLGGYSVFDGGRPATPPRVRVAAGEAHATGSLVATYPRRAVPVAPGSRVVSSSVSPLEDRVQVALVARVRDGVPVRSVLRYYRHALAGDGFTEQATRAVGGADAASFHRDDGSVVVTAGPGAMYSVFAILTGSRA